MTWGQNRPSGRHIPNLIWEFSDLDASPADVPTTSVAPRRKWRTLAGRTFRASTTDRVSLAAAGCAFYATLALFPAISMLVSVYGLVFDPVSVEPQLQVLAGLLPPPAFALINDRVHQLVNQSGGNLSVGLLISSVLT